MPVFIGGKAESTFTNPIGLLIDCHRRIERFLSVLAQVGAQARGEALNPEQRAALETALHYFREAAPKHTADEEETLFPRLRSADRPEITAVLATIDSLEKEHAWADKDHAEMDRLGQVWLTSGSLPAADAARFSALAGELTELYRAHISVEEREVFPLAAAILAEPEQRAMGSEMAARRGLARA
jgi:hemerythrin-like domain-containing protein